jgi:choline-sulfatase
MKSPNIVLLSVDCLRYDRCGFAGHSRETTPTLDRLAAESYVFDRAYATGPYTTESIPGILAGQHSHNGVHYGDHTAWKAIGSDSPTLASYLGDHGYDSFAALSNPHLTRERRFDRGFDRFTNLRAEGDDERGDDEGDDGFELADLLYEIRSRMRQHDSRVNLYTLAYVAYRYSQYRSDWPTVSGKRVTDKLIQELDRTESPFFAWSHFMDLHAPINPDTVRAGGFTHSNRTLSYLLSDAARVSWTFDPGYETLYDSALRYVDRQVSHVVEELERRNLWDETVLIVTSDHGEVLFDRQGIYGHPRHHLYDEVLRVPLVVRIPGASGERIDRPVSLAWIHEILAEILDVERGPFPSPEPSEPLLDPSAEGSDVVISDSIDESGHSVAVRDGRYKYVTHLGEGGDSDTEYSYASRDLVFRYDTDTGERDPRRTEEAAELGAEARRLTMDPKNHPSIDGAFDSTVEQRLKELGYRT